MKCCGVELKGSEAILVTVTRADTGEFIVDAAASTKISLRDSSDQDAVRSFASAIDAFAKNHNISHFVVRGRNTTGQYAGGANTFKIEGLFQVLPDVEVTILHSTTIAAAKRKHSLESPDTLLRYRVAAFLAACAFMLRD